MRLAVFRTIVSIIMNSFLNKSGTLVCAALAINLTATADEAPIGQLEPYIVSVGPRAIPLSEFSSPVNVLQGADIARQGAPTLGAALEGQAGVTSTGFTAGVSRPVIRGFGGPRVKITSSGIETIDASATSPDHGVPTEAILSERVEVLRGPSTLLYGGSGIGGVVNVVGRELPRQAGDGSLSGALDFRHDTVSDGETGTGYLNYGTEQWALALTALQRRSADYKLPDSAEEDRLDNSLVETDQFSLGGSWFFTPEDFLGFSYSSYDSNYGVPGDEDIAIDLERQQWEAELQVVDPIDLLDVLRVRFGYTDYKHSEFEGDESPTVFDREAWELRAEGAHGALGLFDQGVVGVQLGHSDYAAGGLTVPSTTQSQALFFNEHIHNGSLHYEFGGRIERQTIDAEGSVNPDYQDLASSVAASVIWDIDAANTLALSVNRSQRHPNETELYSNGPHHAMGQYSTGNADLEMETAYGIDLTWRSDQASWSSSVSVFYTLFDDYIFNENQNEVVDENGDEPGDGDGEELNAYKYTATDAEFYGFEAELDLVLHRSVNSELIWGFMADTVHATDRDSGENLPRIPAMRLGSHLDLSWQDWAAKLDYRYAFKQSDLAATESETASYSLLNLALNRRIDFSAGYTLTLYVQANNLLDKSIRYHSAYNKEDVMQPGRNFAVGGRFEF